MTPGLTAALPLLLLSLATDAPARAGRLRGDPVVNRTLTVPTGSRAVAAPQAIPTTTRPAVASTADVDPLSALGCAGTVVESISQLAESKDSLTTLRDVRSGARRTLRAGGAIAEYRVAFIGYNPRLRAPSVWLWNDSGLCQLTLNGPAPAPVPDAPVLPAKTDQFARPGSKPANLAQRISAALTEQPDGVRTVTRHAVTDILDHLPELQQQARLFPALEQNRQAGWRLSFAKHSALARLGFESDDVLKRINKFDLSTPEGALRAYGRLREEAVLHIEIERGGRPVTLTYRIEP